MNTNQTLVRLSIVLSMFAAATAARAQTTAAPADELSAICTDRPTKSNYACVIEEGHFQYEADLVNYSHLKVDGTTTDVYLATNPTFKYGLAKDVDIEANIVPWEVVRTRDSNGATSTLRGAGDLYLRAKWNFLNGPDAKLTMTVLPYIKAPTARRGIGNKAVEGGVLLPTNYALTDKITLTTVPEFDALKDSSGAGRHFNTAQLVNVGYALPHDLTAYAEVWGDWNIDPAGTVRQYSADAALAWGITKYLQVDVGLNFGLNKATPSVQAYVGVSQKF